MKELLERVRQWCERRPVKLCILFGSQAAGRTHARSDVDLALWPTVAITPELKLQWLGELESLLGAEVSLVLVSPALDPVLGMEVVRHGVLVYETAPELWFEKRLDLWHTYNDALPFIRAQMAAVGKFAREVVDGS